MSRPCRRASSCSPGNRDSARRDLEERWRRSACDMARGHPEDPRFDNHFRTRPRIAGAQVASVAGCTPIRCGNSGRRRRGAGRSRSGGGPLLSVHPLGGCPRARCPIRRRESPTARWFTGDPNSPADDVARRSGGARRFDRADVARHQSGVDHRGPGAARDRGRYAATSGDSPTRPGVEATSGRARKSSDSQPDRARAPDSSEMRPRAAAPPPRSRRKWS